ncbi:cell division protein ZapA [uncultured Algimonas sp.]|uniref:cell division protein ZapA n=1 Tax=uncultured Algimonas sp. TaxID=1547920 RepID=UPI00260B4663|nr:cell division protein ZapA [uncultured Algimonas sp.]
MGKVNLDINGRAYALGCEDGEEERLERLGERLDRRVAQMSEQFGQIGDLRLLVMAGITLLDEMEDPKASAEARVERRLKAADRDVEEAAKAQQTAETEATEALLKAASRIERLAGQLSDAAG